MKGDPLVSPCIVCYAEKEEKPFWFSSLGQMIQFGTIKFRSTLKNYFGQFVWIEKKIKKCHYNSRVSLHEAPTKNSEKKTGFIIIFYQSHEGNTMIIYENN